MRQAWSQYKHIFTCGTQVLKWHSFKKIQKRLQTTLTFNVQCFENFSFSKMFNFFFLTTIFLAIFFHCCLSIEHAAHFRNDCQTPIHIGTVTFECCLEQLNTFHWSIDNIIQPSIDGIFHVVPFRGLPLLSYTSYLRLFPHAI